MRFIIASITFLGMTLTAGYSGSSKPVIDPAGVDMEEYNADLAECEQIAEQVDQKAGTGAAGHWLHFLFWFISVENIARC